MFPYEVGIVKRSFVENDETMQKIQTPNIPNGIELWVEIDLFQGVKDPVILDYMTLGEIEFPFSPPVPKPMEKYDFFDMSD